MRDTLQLNESLKLQLSKSQAERVTDPDTLKKLQNSQQELKELHRELVQARQQHEVWNLKKIFYESKFVYLIKFK